MKTRVLVRVRQDGQEWEASVYHKDSAFLTVRSESRDDAEAQLRAQAKEILLPQAERWLQEWRGSNDALNCPEGTIRLPIDLWVCKLFDETCPIQAQVLLLEPQKFFGGCLATLGRKQEIFDTVAQGKYEGFHHVPGRFLCVSCEQEGKRLSFRYHYPWELTSVEAYCPSFSLERDWPALRRRLGGDEISLSMVSSALCAEHCRQLAELLDSKVAAELSTFELEVSR